MTGTIPSKPRRRWIRRLSMAGAVLLGLAGVLLVAATCTPGWYNPPTVGPADCREIRNELPTFVSTIGTYMEQSQPFRIELPEEKVNRWLAARGEIWPSLRHALPPEVQDPAVSFQPGRMVLGVRYQGGGISSVLSLAATVQLDETGQAIVLGVGDYRAGLVPVPQSLVEEHARKAMAKALWEKLAGFLRVGDMDLARQLRLSDEQLARLIDPSNIRLSSHGVWPNGKRPFHISNLSIEQGRMLIDIVPVPREAAAQGQPAPPPAARS